MKNNMLNFIILYFIVSLTVIYSQDSTFVSNATDTNDIIYLENGELLKCNSSALYFEISSDSGKFPQVFIKA